MMKVDLAGLLENAARSLRHGERNSAMAFSCEEAAAHVGQLRRGEATVAEFCDLYCLPTQGHDEPDGDQTRILEQVRIVFDGPPSHKSGRFVEVEDSAGKSIRLGEWRERADGLWELVLNAERPAP